MNKNTKQNNTTKKDTTTLRVMNWVFSITLLLFTFIILFNATQTGTIYLLFFLMAAMISYTMPAILLYSGTTKILGFSILLDKKNKLFYKISIGANFLFLLIGVIIILASIYTTQYIVVILGFIVTLLSLSNIKALDIVVKELN